MALIEYHHRATGQVCYVFSGEEAERLPKGPSIDPAGWEALPPDPLIIHTTDAWMSEPTLDSYHSTYELDRQLNIEARDAKEMQLVNIARKNL